MKLLISFALILFRLCSSLQLPENQGYLVNSEVNSTIDLSGQIEYITTRINVSNIGSEVSDYYWISLPFDRNERVSFISAYRGTQKKGFALKVTKLEEGSQQEENVYYRIEWDKPLSPKRWLRFQIKMAFIHTLSPLPAEILQGQKQLVNYKGSCYFYSPYETLEQRVEFLLGTSKIESFSRKPEPIVRKGSKIIVGVYKNIKPYSKTSFGIHYKNDNAFITMTNVLREIEVSHQGRVSITEYYEMLNSGAKLVGQYSMLDQQSYRNPTPHSFRSLKAKLPKSVDNVYFRDRIGNISSSNLRYEKRFSTLEINHRYTLYGGWKNDFEIGYQVPSNEYVVVSKKDKTVHKIEFPFTIPFTVVVIDNLTVKVILPEGATDIHDVLPFQMDNVTEETRFSYLDTTGRPVRVYNKRNVVDFHNQKLMVVYRFTILAILREPFFLFIGFFSALIIFVIFSRINLNLSAPEEFVKIKENSNSSVERKDVNDEADINYNMSLPTKRSAEIAINLITLCEKFQNACKNGIQLGAFSKKHEKQIGQIFESLHLLSKIEKSAIAFCSNLEKLIKAMRKAVAEIDNEKLCKLSTKFEKFVNKLKSA